jgi:hypothetical protein
MQKGQCQDQRVGSGPMGAVTNVYRTNRKVSKTEETGWQRKSIE